MKRKLDHCHALAISLALFLALHALPAFAQQEKQEDKNTALNVESDAAKIPSTSESAQLPALKSKPDSDDAQAPDQTADGDRKQEHIFVEPWLEEIIGAPPEQVEDQEAIDGPDTPGTLGKIGQTGIEIAGALGGKSLEIVEGAGKKGVEIIQHAGKLIDEQHKWFSGELESTAILVDSYFDNENTNIESNQSQIKVNLAVFYEQGSVPNPGMGLDVKLVLPRFEKRLHLIINGDPEELTTGADQTIRNPSSILPKAEDVPKTAALRYFLIAVDRMSLSLDGGADVKGTDPLLFLSSRYRLNIDLHPTKLRFTQYAKWYTDTGSQLITRFEWDQLLNDSWLMRSSAEGSWYEQKEGYFYFGRLEMYHTLKRNSVIYYSGTLYLATMPENRISNMVIKALHRRNIWRPWFFIEGAVQASWPEETRYTVVPAVSLNVQILFGRFEEG
ncbi:MAG: hypothetical protein OEY50_01240 [Nitrospinota bacterium]|nr:hypothetical protein [Nitrospinota bacterium]